MDKDKEKIFEEILERYKLAWIALADCVDVDSDIVELVDEHFWELI